ncbi:hypothetical protein [Anaeromassilibacillus sp. An200]|uniref:hypothetical protein n=1 Tax=Anaeromassilibacillus sp. An200 TaxID=1965587 RepID=UPI000B3AC616|nr:hypothetical protein [Anaeromassilibacillus sp. An200]OUP12782.1 hypothetical protein B5F35_06875 [Anaeromassilibacillus sp. An200]
MANITDGNYLVYNQGNAPLVNNHFMLRVELLFDLPCKSVRTFTREMEYELIQEGGLNDYVHRRRKPNTNRFYFEIDRYVGLDYIDPLPLGAELVLPVLLFVSRYQGQFIPGVVARTFVFTGCTVTRKDYGELDAKESGLMVETTRIDYNEMLCIDIPWSSADVFNIGSGPANPPTNAKSSPNEEETGTGNGTGAGSETGTGSGTGTGNGTGAGSDTGTGSSTDTGSGTGTGSETGAGSSTGTGSGTEAGGSTGAESGTSIGSGNETGAESDTSAESGTDTENAAGAASETGEESSSGSEAGSESPSVPSNEQEVRQPEPEEYGNLLHLDV